MVHDNKVLPRRIILMRHGESMGNLDQAAYATTPDHKIPLTPSGLAAAREAGKRLKTLLSSTTSGGGWRVCFYVSPYERTGETMREVGRSFSRRRVVGAREECRVREQDFGNFQVAERMRVVKETRERFGRFYYRFPEGESAADVFDRVSSFLESFWRDLDMNRLHINPSDELNVVIISHGLTSRVFLMKWFKWTVEQFERLENFGNCEFRVIELGPGGEYSLAVRHSDEEMLGWGMSHEMIEDQKSRLDGGGHGGLNDHCPWYLDKFFDCFAASDDDDSNENQDS